MSCITPIAVITALAASVAGTASVQAPAAAVRAFHAALAAGDSGKALAPLDANVVIYESGGVEASRRQQGSP
jgi:hypothetical protein